MADALLNRRRKLSVRTKVLFASGALQEAVVTAGGIATVLFYNQLLGVSPGLVGTAFLIASAFDALSDPLIGAFTDRFRSKWGRRHPFMFASALPIGFSFYFLYQPADDLTEIGYFVWLCFFLILLRLSQTLYLIPHDALGAELTDDYEERTSIFGYNYVATSALSLIVVGIFYAVIFPSNPEFDNGLLNPAGYFVLAAVGSVTIVFSVLTCTLGTVEQIPYLHNVELGNKFSFANYITQLKALIKNISYISACLSLLTIYSGLGIISVVSTYAYVYVYELSTEGMVWASVAKSPGILIALPLLAYLSRRMEKKTILIVSTLATCALVSLPHNLKMVDLFPSNDSVFLLFALFVPLLLAYMVFPVSAIIIDSQLADVADEHELRTGERSEGVIFSVRSFGIKTTQGVGGFLAGFGLEFIGFPENAEVGDLAGETITGLLFLNGPSYLAIYLLAVLFMTLYALDKKTHGEVLRQLEKKRELL